MPSSRNLHGKKYHAPWSNLYHTLVDRVMILFDIRFSTEKWADFYTDSPAPYLLSIQDVKKKPIIDLQHRIRHPTTETDIQSTVSMEIAVNDIQTRHNPSAAANLS